MAARGLCHVFSGPKGSAARRPGGSAACLHAHASAAMYGRARRAPHDWCACVCRHACKRNPHVRKQTTKKSDGGELSPPRPLPCGLCQPSLTAGAFELQRLRQANTRMHACSHAVYVYVYIYIYIYLSHIYVYMYIYDIHITCPHAWQMHAGTSSVYIYIYYIYTYVCIFLNICVMCATCAAATRRKHCMSLVSLWRGQSLRPCSCKPIYAQNRLHCTNDIAPTTAIDEHPNPRQPACRRAALYVWRTPRCRSLPSSDCRRRDTRARSRSVVRRTAFAPPLSLRPASRRRGASQHGRSASCLRRPVSSCAASARLRPGLRVASLQVSLRAPRRLMRPVASMQALVSCESRVLAGQRLALAALPRCPGWSVFARTGTRTRSGALSGQATSAVSPGAASAVTASVSLHSSGAGRARHASRLGSSRGFSCDDACDDWRLGMVDLDVPGAKYSIANSPREGAAPRMACCITAVTTAAAPAAKPASGAARSGPATGAEGACMFVRRNGTACMLPRPCTPAPDTARGADPRSRPA